MNAVLDAINNHVSGIERRYDTKRLTNASVRSFLMHNRVTLPRDQHSSSADPCHLLRESEDLESRVLELEQAAKREGVSQE